MATFAEKMKALCPKHKQDNWILQRGFRCICDELSKAFAMGSRAVKATRRTMCSDCGGPR